MTIHAGVVAGRAEVDPLPQEAPEDDEQGTDTGDYVGVSCKGDLRACSTN